MEKHVAIVLVLALYLSEGVNSQFDYKDEYRSRRNYAGDYPDILDYDDTHQGTNLDKYLLNEQYTRDVPDGDITYFDPDRYNADGYNDNPFHRVNNPLGDTQQYRETHAFLSKGKQVRPYEKYDIGEEGPQNGHDAKIAHNANKKKSADSAKKGKKVEEKDIAKNAHSNTHHDNSHQAKLQSNDIREVKDDHSNRGPHLKNVVVISKDSRDTGSQPRKSTVSAAKNTSNSSVLAGGIPQPRRVSTRKDNTKLDDAFFGVVVAACSVAGVAGLALAGYCWYKLRKESKQVTEGEIVGYSGNTGEKLKANYGGNNGDEKLTKSAEMYHYLHAKKQLTAMDSNGKDGSSTKRLHIHDASDTSDEESDNTVYECPGLAPPGDMKVVNPLFSDAESRHSDHHSDAKSEGSASSSPPYRMGRSSMSSASSRP